MPELILNTTVFSPSHEPNSACFSWCKEQYFVHSSNLTIEGLSIVVIALISLFLFFLYLRFSDHLNIENKDKTDKLILLLPEFAMYLIIGFLIWFVWFA